MTGMAILIDPPLWPAHGRLWSHLVSDVSFDELHAFARSLGVPGRGFEGDHYDVPQERYGAMVAAGARPVPGRELLARLLAAGLRRPKRRGERVIASVHTAPDHRTDVLASSLPPLHPVRFVRVLAGDRAAVLAVRGPRGWVLPGLALPPGRPAARREELAVRAAAPLAGEGWARRAAWRQVGYLRRQRIGDDGRPAGRAVVEVVLRAGLALPPTAPAGRAAARTDPGRVAADSPALGALLAAVLDPPT